MTRAGWGAGIGATGILLTAVVVAMAPVLAPNRPDSQFANRAYAPPTQVRLVDANGVRAPFVYAQILEDRVMRRYRDDTTHALPLRWFTGGRLVSVDDDGGGPLLLLGADALGRDIFSRLVTGARLSLGVALAGTLGALLLGAVVGGLGGRLDSALMLMADFVIVLPGVYLVLVLRALLPPVLETAEVFVLISWLFTLAGWPHVARGVRAIVATERARDYAEAARASGAGPVRLVRQLLPAARGFLLVETVLLLPALLVAEATISYLGLGFPEPAASWGTMLRDAANVAVMGQAPWILAPAIALFLVVLCVQLAGGARAATHALFAGAPGGARH
jgi:peptide/nickel transport system permease protein